jgi:hypothetical protein
MTDDRALEPAAELTAAERELAEVFAVIDARARAPLAWAPPAPAPAPVLVGHGTTEAARAARRGRAT